MPICFICKQRVLDIKLLRIHFEYRHEHVSFYKCVEDDCQRKFDTFNSLKRHFHLRHDQEPQRLKNQNANLDTEQKNNFISNINNQSDTNSFGSCDNSALDLPHSLQHDPDIRNRVMNKVASFFTKLSSKSCSKLI